MSTVRLLKDHGDDKKGATVSRPLHVANEMVAAGIAERPGVPPPPPSNVSIKTFERAGQRINDLEAELKKVKEENNRLRAAAAKHPDEVAALESENKRLTDQVVALQKAAGTAK